MHCNWEPSIFLFPNFLLHKIIGGAKELVILLRLSGDIESATGTDDIKKFTPSLGIPSLRV
jgi:hypothetical protein